MYASIGGIMVSIAAFQAVDPGSIPGRYSLFLTERNVFHYAAANLLLCTGPSLVMSKGK